MQRLSKVMESLTRAGHPWVFCDSHGKVLEINPPFAAMCGFTEDEVKGKKPKEFLHGAFTEPDKKELLSSYLWNRLPVSTQITNYRKNGEPYRVHLTILPYTMPDQEEPCFFGIPHELGSRDAPDLKFRTVVFDTTRKLFGSLQKN